MMITGKSVLVVGSSPSVCYKTVMSGSYDIKIFVNGSAAPFKCINPDITVINGFTVKRSDPVANATMDSLKHTKLGHAVCLTAGMDYLSMNRALQHESILFSGIEEFTEDERVRLAEIALGRNITIRDSNDKPSTGLSAILWAISRNPKSIFITGFSLDGGHSYINGQTPRGHASIDSELLNAIDNRLNSNKQVKAGEQ